jgi:hypothetical protein
MRSHKGSPLPVRRLSEYAQCWAISTLTPNPSCQTLYGTKMSAPAPAPTDTRVPPQELLLARATPEDLVNSKAMNFGGAGAALATILLIAQIGVVKPALVWALALAAAALPLWIALALTYDAWITLKLGVRDLHVLRWLRHIQSYGFLACVLLMFASIGCLLYSLSPVSLLVFAIATFVGVALVVAAIVGAMLSLRHLWK